MSAADRLWLMRVARSIAKADQRYVGWAKVTYSGKTWIVAYVSLDGTMPIVISDTGPRRGMIDKGYRNFAAQHLYFMPCSGDEFAGPPE